MRRSSSQNLPLVALIAGVLACPPLPITLKTIDLSPQDSPVTGGSGIAGAFGYCFSSDSPPPSSFSPGPAQAMVGFDDYFAPGAQPFPCNTVRDETFRGGIKFDLSQFDTIGSADLLFDTVNSLSRSNGETVGQNPPESFATTIGMGTQAFSSASEMPDDSELPLPAGPSFDIGVSSQVRAWLGGRSNFGFIIGGPRPTATSSSYPQDNDAQMSWYGNFRLRVLYNPAMNPRAPQ